MSLWRIGTNRTYPHPLALLNSESNYREVVENLAWTQDGKVLLVNVMKRYINLVRFGDKAFGTEVSLADKMNIIEQCYGVTSITQINNQNI